MSPTNPTYLNPVYKGNFADPFVLKYCGSYWAYCTGVWQDGRCFGVLHSTNLVDWQEVGGAMAALPGDWPCYWAPEVSYINGKFYLYYSAGNEKYMHLRVALAAHPAGPFEDSGQQLTSEQFAIDPHVFLDEKSGQRYLFYATDFLDYPRIGTGTVADKLLDPLHLAGQPHPVTRARYDWQIYDSNRQEKGGVRWHTVEGPFVLEHQNRYYQMFSGGNWQNLSYGVSYAVSDSLDNPQEWKQDADGEQVLPILRSIDGVKGPGHNSVVRGPDNRQLFCVYHRWSPDGTARQMAIDLLDWVGDRMIVFGPSVTPQPAPRPATVTGFADLTQPGSKWRIYSGQWELSGEEGQSLRQTSLESEAKLIYRLEQPSFLVEMSLRGEAGTNRAGASFGLGLDGGDGQMILSCMLSANGSGATVKWLDKTGWQAQTLALPPGFDPHVYHLFHLEVSDHQVKLRLDEGLISWQNHLENKPFSIALLAHHTAIGLGGFALTNG